MRKANTSIINSPQFPIFLLSIIVAVLNSCVLSPLYIQIENNIIFEYTVLPIILDYLILLFDTIYISLLFSALTYSVYAIHKGMESKLNTTVFVLAIVVLKHILNLAVSSIIDSYIDIAFDIPMTLYLILIDLLMLAIVAIIANQKCKKHFSHAKAMLKASKYLQTVEYNEMEDIYPFKGFLKIKGHPILLPIFVGSVMSAGIFIIQRLFADFVVLDAPESIFEILDIVGSYASDILFGLISYTVSYFSVTFIFLKSTEKN